MVINAAGETVTVPAGATDAALTPHHVERGKLFVQSRFAAHPLLDVPRVCAAIEKTRFPVPEASDLGDGVSWGDLVQAADLIGQLADPDYMRKLPALYYEFEETGTNARMGNDVPGRLGHLPELFLDHGERTYQARHFLSKAHPRGARLARRPLLPRVQPRTPQPVGLGARHVYATRYRP